MKEYYKGSVYLYSYLAFIKITNLIPVYKTQKKTFAILNKAKKLYFSYYLIENKQLLQARSDRKKS